MIESLTNDELKSLIDRYYVGDNRPAEEQLDEISNSTRIADLLTQDDFQIQHLGAGMLLILVDLRLRAGKLEALGSALKGLVMSLEQLSGRRLQLPLETRKEIARQLLQARASILLYCKEDSIQDSQISDSAKDLLHVASRFYHRSRSLGQWLLVGRSST